MAKQQKSSSLKTWVPFSLVVAGLLGGIVTREQRDFRHMANRTLPFGALASTETQIPEGEYFDQLVTVLKSEYVESVDDEMKLATGAVKGMINSLADLHSIYYDAEDFKIFFNTMKGSYEGIGADLVFQYPKVAKPQSESEEGAATAIPQVVIAGVVPGGPADRAGLKPGDWFESIDGFWVMNSALIEKARVTQQKVESKEWPQSKMDELRKEIRTKMDKNIAPMKAWHKVQTGTSGELKVVVMRGESPVSAVISKQAVSRPAEGETIRPSFAPGTEKAFADFVRDRKTLTFDIRGASAGDLKTTLDYLGMLVKPGAFGSISRERKSALPLEVKGSRTDLPTITVLADSQTQGVPAIFALILKKSGATLTGQPDLKPIATEVSVLPDGSGYTLRLGTYAEALNAANTGGSK